MNQKKIKIGIALGVLVFSLCVIAFTSPVSATDFRKSANYHTEFNIGVSNKDNWKSIWSGNIQFTMSNAVENGETIISTISFTHSEWAPGCSSGVPNFCYGYEKTYADWIVTTSYVYNSYGDPISFTVREDGYRFSQEQGQAASVGPFLFEATITAAGVVTISYNGPINGNIWRSTTWVSDF